MLILLQAFESATSLIASKLQLQVSYQIKCVGRGYLRGKCQLLSSKRCASIINSTLVMFLVQAPKYIILYLGYSNQSGYSICGK